MYSTVLVWFLYVKDITEEVTNMYTMWYERVSRWYKNVWYEKMLVRKTQLPLKVNPVQHRTFPMLKCCFFKCNVLRQFYCSSWGTIVPPQYGGLSCLFVPSILILCWDNKNHRQAVLDNFPISVEPQSIGVSWWHMTGLLKLLCVTGIIAQPWHFVVTLLKEGTYIYPPFGTEIYSNICLQT